MMVEMKVTAKHTKRTKLEWNHSLPCREMPLLDATEQHTLNSRNY